MLTSCVYWNAVYGSNHHVIITPPAASCYQWLGHENIDSQQFDSVILALIAKEIDKLFAGYRLGLVKILPWQKQLGLVQND